MLPTRYCHIYVNDSKHLNVTIIQIVTKRLSKVVNTSCIFSVVIFFLCCASSANITLWSTVHTNIVKINYFIGDNVTAMIHRPTQCRLTCRPPKLYQFYNQEKDNLNKNRMFVWPNNNKNTFNLKQKLKNTFSFHPNNRS